MKNPKELGYHMPAEWETHVSTWLAWPHNAETFPTRHKFVPASWIQMIKALHVEETVHILVNNQEMKKEVHQRLEWADVNFRKARLHILPTDDCWMRDTGPTFVKSPTSKGMVGWIFNAWGGKWEPFDQDALVSSRIAEKMKPLPFFRPGIVMEGGSIEVNGSGTLLTTESCLLSDKRNPSKKQDDIQQLLKDFLGVKNVLWLSAGVPQGDDTDGHIDNLARFVNKTTIVAPLEKDKGKPNFELLSENFLALKSMKDQDGRPFDVIALPTPEPILFEGSPLPVSYANFYIGNGVILMPSFDDPKDHNAARVLRKYFPKRRIVPIPSRDIVLGFGGVHCVTQQEPQ